MFFYLCLFAHRINEKGQLQNILQTEKTQITDLTLLGHRRHKSIYLGAQICISKNTNLYTLDHKFIYHKSQIYTHYPVHMIDINVFLAP